jgi:hypothetical protein
MRLRARSLSLLLLASIVAPHSAAAQSTMEAPAPCRAPLTADTVVQNLTLMNLQRAQALHAYHGTRIYKVDYRGFPVSRSAEMVVEVKYESPGSKEFTIQSQTGSKLILDRVFKKLLEGEKEAFEADNQKRTALNNDNYVFKFLSCEAHDNGSIYVLSVEPKAPSRFLYRGRIWVDANDFAVVRIAAEPAKNPSFWIKNTAIEQMYAKVGDFWLPARNHSVSTIRLGGRADFTIEYKDYQITSASPAISLGSTASSRR